MDGCCFMCYYAECHQKTVIVGSNRDYNEKKNVHGTGGSSHRSHMVVAAGNGELKIQSEASVQKVHAAEIHQIGVEPIPATGQITIEDLLAVQGGETEDPRAVEGMSDPEDVPVDEASVEDTNADEYASLAIANVTNYVMSGQNRTRTVP